MEITDIWIGIIIPILIGPLFLYVKTLYDNYVKNRNDHRLLVYNNKYDKLTNILNNFYWPLYIKLLCISQLSYYIPLKNEYEYNSDSSNDSKNSDIRINILNNNSISDIILDMKTLNLMENNINNLYSDALKIIENNIYLINNSNILIMNLINFIKYCKIRPIIHDGSIEKKYNIEYLGIKNNIEKMIELIKEETFETQNKFNYLMSKGPFH